MVMFVLSVRENQKAKQLQPNAPQKLEKSDTGTLDLRARSCACPCTPQAPWHWCARLAAGRGAALR
jgi:hypothetical protein